MFMSLPFGRSIRKPWKRWPLPGKDLWYFIISNSVPATSVLPIGNIVFAPCVSWLTWSNQSRFAAPTPAKTYCGEATQDKRHGGWFGDDGPLKFHIVQPIVIVASIGIVKEAELESYGA